MGKLFHKNQIKRILSPILCAAMTLSLAACGAQNTESVPEEGGNYVYVPEYITLPNEGENSYFNGLTLDGNSLYYSTYEYDVETQTSSETLISYSMEDKSQKEIPLNMPENSSLSTFSRDGDGNICAVMYDYSEEITDEEGFLQPKMILSKFDAQGAVVFEKDITEEVKGVVEDVYISDMVVDKSGNIYLAMDSMILLLNPDGEMQGTIDNGDSWINCLGVGKNGNVYFCYYDYISSSGGMVLAEIDFKTKKVVNTYKNIPGMNGSGLSVGLTKDFLINDGSKVYEYDLATQSSEELFSWVDCDIDGNMVDYVGVTDSGVITAIIQDWNTGGTSIAKMNKVKATEVAEKEEVVIASLYNNQELQAAVVAFNKSSDKYRVTIKTYIDENDWDENSYSTAMTNLQNDLLSDTNCPDIMDLAQINEMAMISKGVFEDLYPYLEKSTVLSKEDFIESILDGFSYDGKLYSIPASFYIDTIAAKTSVVGEEMGWTLEEMMEIAKEYPDAVFFDGEQKSSILYSCMLYNQDSFVDWEKGECYFDSDEFKQVLEFTNMFPDEIDWETYEEIGVEELKNNAVLLERAYISNPQDIQIYPARFDEEVTFIGFPTSDGSVGCGLSSGSRYGISSKSQNKEGAWAFIESYLTDDSNDMYSWNMSALKDVFEKQIEEETTLEYVLDENGEKILDENGEPITNEVTSSISYSNGWSYTYHMPTEEEVQTLRDLIAVARPAATIDEELLNILLEEADAYFSGQKSIDEVTDIIQSRAQIYISENS